MPINARGDDTLQVNPVDALTCTFLEFSDIYGNLFDSDKSELMFEMGKTIRAITKCLSKLSIDFGDLGNANDDSFFDDEE